MNGKKMGYRTWECRDADGVYFLATVYYGQGFWNERRYVAHGIGVDADDLDTLKRRVAEVGK